MDNPSNLFTLIIEALLQGRVVCEYTEEEAYKELQNKHYFNEVNLYLNKIGRKLKVTQDKVGYFAGYINLDKSEYRTAVKSQFSETINNLEPMVRWLHIAISASRMDRPVSPGDVLKLTELLEAIENAPILCEELDTLSRTRLFSNSQSSEKGKLESIMKKLVDQRYMINTGRTGTKFIATGKWSRLYELMEFISSHEQIDMEDDEQVEMTV